MKSLGISHHDASFIVQGFQLSGVTSVDGSYSVTQSPVNVLGFGYTTPTLGGPFVGNFSLERNMVSKDPLLTYTGESYLNGAIGYDSKNFGFTSGYLTSYSITCEVGRLPSISNNIAVFGEIGGDTKAWTQETTIQNSSTHPAIQIPQQGTIEVTCDGSTSNRVRAFSYSVNSDRDPIYIVNSSQPVQVNLRYPLEVDAIVVMEIDDYESRQAKDYLTSHSNSNITISIKDPADNSVIESYSLESPELINESINTSVGSDTVVELSYKGYVNKR